MDYTDAYTYLVEQSQLFGERTQVSVVLGCLPGKFDHKRLPLEALDVWKGLAQKVETQLIADFVCVSHGRFESYE
jgi:hypothetical protein